VCETIAFFASPARSAMGIIILAFRMGNLEPLPKPHLHEHLLDCRQSLLTRICSIVSTGENLHDIIWDFIEEENRICPRADQT
jgi:hypothetical protein